MFTIFKLKDSTRFSTEEEMYLLRMLQRYSVTLQGLWLQDLDFRKFQFFWCPAMLDSGGVMGCFNPLFAEKIFLLPSGNDVQYPETYRTNGRVFWVEQMFPTIIHELRHAYQWRNSKLGYILCALPILREFTLEKEARNTQRMSETFAAQWTAEYNHREAAERGLASDVKVGKEARNAGGHP